MASIIMIRSLIISASFLAKSTYGYVVTARGKPVSASSVYQNGFEPQKAVDGDTNSVFPNVFHTAIYQSSSWWKVDLGEMVFSPQVTIHFRRYYKVRRNGVRISISPNNVVSYAACEVVTGAADGSNIPDIYDFQCDGYGRYLIVSTETANDEEGAALDFGEVEVYACSLYTFGHNCASECHCEGTSCNWRNPVCSSGCPAGWKSAVCDTLVSATEVSVYTKLAEICDVPVSFNLESIALNYVLQMEHLELESRIECLHKCKALILCVSFEYSSPTCTLWRSGSSGFPGSRDMWKK